MADTEVKGTYIGRDVNTEGGDFISRDFNVTNNYYYEFLVVNTIVGEGTELDGKNVKRAETIIEILKTLKASYQPQANDFDSLYIYTLIEYGIRKPKRVLEFFCGRLIRKAFHKAFNNKNLATVYREVESIIDWNGEAQRFSQPDFNLQYEFVKFTSVFNEIVNQVQSPTEISPVQRIEEIHDKSEAILNRLERINTLENLWLELTKLFPTSESRFNQLDFELRGWFNSLKFQFESYEKYEDDYFEWIINVPNRRGYDRIIVRGVRGEINIQGVNQIYEQVSQHQTDEGWIVAVRRISPAAIERAKAFKNIFCYTLDDLIDEYVDFSNYIRWLEKEIDNRDIENSYIPLAATKSEFDTQTQKIVGQSSFDETNGWIDGYVDRWLEDLSKEHISILGEFGTGKTWFTLHYAKNALNRYIEAKKRGLERPRLPLVISLRDYAKAVSVESLFSEFFFRRHEISIPGYSAFQQLNHMGKFLFIFDGFDEMSARIDKQKMINNFWELARVVVPGAKAILTCRTEHFPTAKEGRALLNAEIRASTFRLSGNPPQFEVLNLKLLDEHQIQQILIKRAPIEIVQHIMAVPNLLDLMRRPIMTELILDALPEIRQGKPLNLSRLYLYAIRRKMERDIRAERTFTSMTDKLYFLCELSWTMLSTDTMSINYRHIPKHIYSFFGFSSMQDSDLDHWQYDMMGQSMLVRNDDGDYMPAHRSFLEFFVAYKLCAEIGVLSEDFVNIIREEIHVDRNDLSYDSSWTKFFLKAPLGNDSRVRLLRSFVRESKSHICMTLGKGVLSQAVIELMSNMTVEEHLWNVLDITRKSTFEECGYIGCNIIALLLIKDISMTNRDLSFTILTGADFRGSRLRGCSFRGADIKDTNFAGADLQDVNLNDVSGADSADFSNLLRLPDKNSLSQSLLVHIAKANRKCQVCLGDLRSTGNRDEDRGQMVRHLDSFQTVPTSKLADLPIIAETHHRESRGHYIIRRTYVEYCCIKCNWRCATLDATHDPGP